jgi:AcrR family transcriptional regulator
MIEVSSRPNAVKKERNRTLQPTLKPARPRRGSPRDTRDRLVAAAALLFNRTGYHGTDSNQIAHKAGYSTGIFYKHFKNKRDIFLAAYETWVSSQWKDVASELSAGGSKREIARRLVTLSIGFHTRWRGSRASLHELLFTDEVVYRFYCRQRRRQLDTMAKLRSELGLRPRSREQDAIHLYTTERIYDAIARGELRDLGLSRKFVVDAMTYEVAALLK